MHSRLPAEPEPTWPLDIGAESGPDRPVLSPPKSKFDSFISALGQNLSRAPAVTQAPDSHPSPLQL